MPVWSNLNTVGIQKNPNPFRKGNKFGLFSRGEAIIQEQVVSTILRLTMMPSEMPISERLIAGKKHIGEGGNGDCYYLHELIQKHIK